MPSLADQTTAELGGPFSVLTRQRLDHIELDRLLDDLRGTVPQQQGPVLRRIYRLVFPHAFAEESVLWPVFRRVLPEGRELTLRIEQEHQLVNELVSSLEDLDADDPARPPLLEHLRATLSDDVRDEEDDLLPRVQERLDPIRLRLLGLAWEAVRRVAPTRAHPVVARRPPGNVLAAVPLSIIDRLRDRTEAAAERHGGRAGRLLGHARRGLADLAHRVERTRALRLGEHPSTSLS